MARDRRCFLGQAAAGEWAPRRPVRPTVESHPGAADAADASPAESQ